MSGKMMFVASDCGCDYGEARQCELYAGFSPEERVIACETCGGDGGGEVVIGHDPSGPVTSWSRCTMCDGMGRYLVEMEPITVEDLDDE